MFEHSSIVDLSLRVLFREVFFVLKLSPPNVQRRASRIAFIMSGTRSGQWKTLVHPLSHKWLPRSMV